MIELLEADDDARIRVDFVWTPAWGQAGDFERAAQEMPVNPDPRARAWHDGDLLLGTALADYVMGDPPVYDLYMIYEAGREWGDSGNDSPGEPDLLQMGHMDTWDPEVFWDEVEDRLPDCESVLVD